MIAQLEYQPRKILEQDSLSEIQDLIGKCQGVDEYFYPILKGFYRFCKKNAFYETSKLLCASVREHSSESTEKTDERERLLILLESEFSLVIHICLFWSTIHHQGSEIDVKMQECDRRLAKSLCDNNSMMLNNRSAGKGFELIECPSQVTNYQEAEVLSKVMLEFMDKIATQSETCQLDLQTSAHYLEANKTFLGIERLEDKKEFVKGLSCKMLATFCEDLETKCQLLRQSQNHFLRLNHILDKDFS